MYVPAAAYVKVGFCAAESVVPSLVKSHAHVVGLLVDESVNATASGATPEVRFAAKLATGATGAAVTVI